MKKFLFIPLILSQLIVGCSNDAKVASVNLSQAADNFELPRRIVFYNGITGDYILSIEGLCSFEVESERKVAVICKVGDKEYKKHTLGISDNVTFFSEQLEAKPVSAYHYRVIFKPQSIIPDVDLKTSSNGVN